METLNTRGSEYGIAYFNDNLIYASTGNPVESGAKQIDVSPRTGLPYSKFYMSAALGGSYNKGELAVGLNKSKNVNEGTFAYDPVNRLGYYTRCEGNNKNSQCYIFFAEFKNSQWKEIDNLKIESRKEPIGHPFVMPNGNRIYFTSNMEGGYGKSDLWYTDKLPDGTWSKPINLGREVNTAGSEGFPFVSDGYLFFSSDGHPGYGGMDIYASKIDGNVHGKAINLGLPFNSSQDDLNLIEKYDLSEGMLVSARRTASSDDIFRFEGFPSFLTASGSIYDSITRLPMAKTPIEVKKDGKIIEKLESDENGKYIFFIEPDSSEYELSASVIRYNPATFKYRSIKERFGKLENWNVAMLGSDAYISGVVRAHERLRNNDHKDLGPIVGAKVVVYENGIQVKVVETNSNGEYRFGDVKENTRYTMRCLAGDDYFVDSKDHEVGLITQSIEFCTATGYNLDFSLEKLQKEIQLSNIEYDYNKFTLRPEAIVELNKFVELLNKNPHMKIQIRSHTDSKGSISFNDKLSNNRAKSVIDYLVSQGIPSGRLSWKGLGERELLIKPEKTDEDRQRNRRTEFTVVGTTGEQLYDTRMPVTQSLTSYRGAQQITDYPQPQYQQPQYQQPSQPQYQPPQSTGNLQNMPYRVQVLASSTYNLSKPEFIKIKQQFNLDVYVESAANGVYRYFVGGFNTMEEAKALANRMNSALKTEYFAKAK
jgi:outer membrane protein OmpA-like peptidoglycan-associated protein